MHPPADTIAAVATAAGRAGIGIVRASGPAVPDIATRLLGRPPRPRHAHRALIHGADGAPIDEVILLHFPAPHSFTGEHVLELHGHGNPVLQRLLLDRLHELGTRAAAPGEFSQRAFLNGRLDLAQAEAIADLIAAGSEAAARAALRSLDGEFSRRVDALLEALIALRLQVEAAIDFPEEEIDFLADGQIAQRLAAVRVQVETLQHEAGRGQRLRDGLHVVILGPPNAGKSSLLNALVGSERAIVADVAGTTRDLLRETVALDGIDLTLVDTAGLRRDGDAIELEGMRRARAERARADLVLVLLAPGDEDRIEDLRDEVAGAARVLWVHAKADLGPLHLPPDAPAADLSISLRDGRGLDPLRTLLREAAGMGEGSEGAFSARQRHLDALRRVAGRLHAAAEQLGAARTELVAEELRLAQQALSEITGAYVADDLLGAIFGSFCIGK